MNGLIQFFLKKKGKVALREFLEESSLLSWQNRRVVRTFGKQFFHARVSSFSRVSPRAVANKEETLVAGVVKKKCETRLHRGFYSYARARHLSPGGGRKRRGERARAWMYTFSSPSLLGEIRRSGPLNVTRADENDERRLV